MANEKAWSKQVSHPDFLALIRERIAQTAVGASAMRGQGKGVVHIVRKHLGKVDLGRFAVRTRLRFEAALDDETEKLRRKLPSGSKRFGTARKAMNLFLRDALYSNYISDHFGLDLGSEWFELPLDSFSVRGIREYPLALEVPKWTAIKRLRRRESREFQVVALNIARNEGLRRVDLDLLFWRTVPKNQLGRRRPASS